MKIYSKNIDWPQSGLILRCLLSKVAEYYRIDQDQLKTAGKESTLTKARAVLYYLAVWKLMISCADGA